MPRLSILGVCHVSDFYPNVKFKLPLIREAVSGGSRDVIFDLGKGQLYHDIKKGFPGRSFLKLLKIAWGHISVLSRFAARPTPEVYICYPGILLAFMLSLFPARLRPRIYLDAFISIYDTVVNDRNLLHRSGLPARLLFKMERRAFNNAALVLTDTRQDAECFAAMFDLPVGRFQALPLAIPPLSRMRKPPEPRTDGALRCVFMGSLVPLQGIRKILDAASELKDDPRIEIQIIGDGQEAPAVAAYVRDQNTSNVSWKRGMFSTEEVIPGLQEADLCLGVFGEGDKTSRVIPYKIYYYMALGKPFITLATPALNDVITESDESFLLDGGDNPGHALAQMISSLRQSPERLKRMSLQSGRIYDSRLSDEFIRARLREILEKS
jgi:glycosyltransferase involved in cell wall biosynthesis